MTRANRGAQRIQASKRWGSNWPHLGLANKADWPDATAALRCLEVWGADSDTLEKILETTPARLFGFSD